MKEKELKNGSLPSGGAGKINPDKEISLNELEEEINKAIREEIVAHYAKKYIKPGEEVWESEYDKENGIRVFYIGKPGNEPSYTVEYNINTKVAVIYAYGTGAGRRILFTLR